MGAMSSMSKRLAPRVSELAPGLTTAFVREALARAIAGVGPLPPAARPPTSSSQEQKGDVDRAIHEVIENHVRLAGAQGFVTNLGGLVTAAVTIPANITGLALIECRMIAGIAHLRGYDLDDPRVRNAILVMPPRRGRRHRDGRARRSCPRRRWRSPPRPPTTPASTRWSSVVVASELIARRSPASGWPPRSAGRVPVVGGLVGMGADGYVTWRIGRYADRELLPRNRR